MHLSAMLTSLPLPFSAAVRQAASLGFTHVDVVALGDRPAEQREALADAGVHVSCAAVGRGLPEGQTLDARPVSLRQAALDEMKRQVADAAGLGATICYVIPGLDPAPEALACFADACQSLADYAGQRMVRLCVEHIPGRALPTVAATLAWLDATSHDNLFLLLDVGHCLISREDPARSITQAGRRLGYVHLDDNDGAGDLHWPLLQGMLREETLAAVFAALKTAAYRDGLALELNPANLDPVAALRDGKALVERLGERGT